MAGHNLQVATKKKGGRGGTKRNSINPYFKMLLVFFPVRDHLKKGKICNKKLPLRITYIISINDVISLLNFSLFRFEFRIIIIMIIFKH